jgi:hypothetical protein
LTGFLDLSLVLIFCLAYWLREKRWFWPNSLGRGGKGKFNWVTGGKYSRLSYLPGICFRAHSEYLKPEIVLNPIFTVFPIHLAVLPQGTRVNVFSLVLCPGAFIRSLPLHFGAVIK